MNFCDMMCDSVSVAGLISGDARKAAFSCAEIWVIEVNPNCYLRRGEVFAEAARRAGYEYDALIGRIVELAAGRYAR